MRRAVILLCLLGLLAPLASARRSSDIRKAYAAGLAAVTPRQGVQHRSLILVALVLRQARESSGLLVDPAGLTWTPGEPKDAAGLATLSRPAVADDAAAAPVVLPSGLVLRTGAHERLLARPVLLKPGTTFGARAVRLGSGAEESDAATERVFAGVAPPEYGHTLFLLSDPEALADLLALEASAVGLNPSTARPSLAALAAHVDVEVRALGCAKAVRALADAYGGETVGHVAFLGDGVIQMVLAASPDTYRGYVHEAASGLGLAMATWESLFGLAAEPTPDARWDDYVEATTRLIRFLGAASFKQERRTDEVGDGGELWRVRATKATRGGRPPDVGWLLLDDDGNPVLLETWPDHAPLPPPPGRTPAAKPETPEAVKGGANTWSFVKRFYERFPWRREPEWLRRTPRDDRRGP